MKHIALLSLLAVTSASAVTYSIDATVAATPPAQYYVYRESAPGVLVLDNTHPVTTALQGTAGAAGGNVELFATGDLDPGYANPANGQPFSTVPVVSLNGTANNAPFALTSLNGTLWFTTSGGYNTTYGAANPANAWFTDFANYVAGKLPVLVVGLFNANRATIYDAFRDAGGFTELSDPNISHLYEDAGQFNIGLAGFLDQSPRLRALLGTVPAAAPFVPSIPDGLQFSEVVMVNGVARYAFAASSSGVVLNDQFGSFNGTYVITAPAPQIPEPASSALALLASAALMRRRR